MSAVKVLSRLSGGWRFLIIMVFAEIGLFFCSRSTFFVGLKILSGLLFKILPVLLLVFLLMSVINYYVTPATVTRHLGGRGVKKWFIAVIGGILSVGPVYLWYPILADLRKRGLSNGWVACFLYNRAIKVPLLPLATYYFGWHYVVTLTLVMVLASIVQAYVITHLEKFKI